MEVETNLGGNHVSTSMILGWCVDLSKLGLLGQLFAGRNFPLNNFSILMQGCDLSTHIGEIHGTTIDIPSTFHGNLKKTTTPQKWSKMKQTSLLQECKQPKPTNLNMATPLHLHSPYPSRQSPVAKLPSTSPAERWAPAWRCPRIHRDPVAGAGNTRWTPRSFVKHGRSLWSISWGWLSHFPRCLNTWNTQEVTSVTRKVAFQTNFFRGQGR